MGAARCGDRGKRTRLDWLGDQLESIQVAVFRSDQDQSEQIYRLLQEAARLSRAMHPMVTIFDKLERGELTKAPRRCHRSSVT